MKPISEKLSPSITPVVHYVGDMEDLAASIQPRKIEVMVYRRFNKLFIRLRNRRAMLRVSR